MHERSIDRHGRDLIVVEGKNLPAVYAEAIAPSGERDPDRVSLVAALRITRQTLAHPVAFPLTNTAKTAPAGSTSSARLLRRPNPARRRWSAPRVVKREYVKWHVKRAHHAAWPQSDGMPTYTVNRDLN